MSQIQQSQFRLRETRFSTDSHRDENAFYNEGFGKPDELTRSLIHIFGNYSKKYPIATITQGNLFGDINARTKTVKDYQYEYPVVGRLNKASIITTATTGTDIGKGFTTFKVVFDDNMLKRFNTVMFEDQTLARIEGDPVKHIDGGWEYTMVLQSSSAQASIPATTLAVGKKAISIGSFVPVERSRGTKSNSVIPGKVKNQIGVIRKSLSWGDAHNLDRVMEVEFIGKNGGKDMRWINWFMYQFEMKWMEEQENLFMYSRYNRTIDANKITMKDATTGENIPTFAGILEQIPNYSTYTKLTYDKLQNEISDAFYGQADTADMIVTLYTGRGGMREFHEALLAKGIDVVKDMGSVADKFITGSGYDLELGGFFNAFYHIDGYYIRVKHYPLFDDGCVAQVRPKHPETGFSLESYRMVFIDEAPQEGEPNLQVVQLDKTGYQHGITRGLTDVPAGLGSYFSTWGNTPPEISSELNEGGYHRMMKMGIQLLRSTRCLHLECVRGL